MEVPVFAENVAEKCVCVCVWVGVGGPLGKKIVLKCCAVLAVRLLKASFCTCFKIVTE